MNNLATYRSLPLSPPIVRVSQDAPIGITRSPLTLTSVSLNGQELEIFRAGDHGIAGKRVFTPAELQQIAQHYATAGHEAPIVIGHPKLNSPAFGWIKSIRAQGSSLFATPHEVAPAFDAAVEAKHYKKRSAAFDPLPDGKGWMLRHVGYLGGTPPVIKGLADATFATEQYEEGQEFSTEGDAAMAGEQQQADQTRNVFLDKLMGFFSSEKPGAQLADLTALEQRLETKFAADLKAKTDALEAKDKEFADFRSAHEKTTKSASAAAAITKLKAEGKWLPAFDRMHVPELFGAIADGNTVEFEFADDKGTHKLPTLDALATLVGSIARFVPKGETFGDEQAKAAAETKVDLPGTLADKADPGSVQFDQAIRARMDKDKCDYPTAQRRLSAEGKSSASYVQASSGAV